MGGIFSKIAAKIAALGVFQFVLIIWIFHPESEMGSYLKNLVGCFITMTFSNGWGFWLKYGYATVYGAWTVFEAMILAYLEVKEAESKGRIAGKVGKTTAKWFAYWLSDWGVEIGIATVIGILKYQNCSWHEIFMAAWTIDVLVALTFIFISKKFIDDFMLMNSLRRAFDALYGVSKLAGSLFLSWNLVKFCFWDGSDNATMFFEKELNSAAKKILAVMFFSSLRILLLVKVFNVGYEMFN